MSVNNTSILCRICLNSDIKKYMSLFEKYKELSVIDYILLITEVDIKKDDGFPDIICSSCFLEFETAVNFKQKCENSDILLKTSKVKITCTDTDVYDITLKKEPYDVNVKFEEERDDSTADEHYVMKDLEDISIKDVRPFKSKTADLKLECHDCGNMFKSKCKLSVHWKRTHMLSSLICDTCKRRFKSYKAYHLHKKNKLKSCIIASNNMVRVEGEGKSRVFHCKECNYKSVRIKDVQSHIVIHSGDRPFQCTICQNRYTQQSSLQSHMEGVHKRYIVEVTCHFCGKELKGRTQVYRHLKSHTEEKFPCTVCQKLISKKNLKVHMQRHSGFKSFTCEHCASTFYTLGELCNHRRWVHNKKKDAYKCDLCSYTASRPDRIKTHRRNHMENNVACIVCGMFFATAQKLEAHKKRHFEEKKHECLYCDKKFYRRDSVGKHIRSKHKTTLEIINERTSPVDFKFKKDKIAKRPKENVNVESK